MLRAECRFCATISHCHRQPHSLFTRRLNMAANPVAPVPDLSLNVVRNGDEILVHCHGRIVSATVATLQDRVRAAIPGSKRIVLDLTDVTYLDSSGLGTLVGLYV